MAIACDRLLSPRWGLCRHFPTQRYTQRDPEVNKRATVLIVEDSEDLRRLYAIALGLHGYRVIEARDGLEALLLQEVDRPDLVILDLDLPKIPGHVVRDELAAGALTREIPVVVVTGSADATAEDLDVPCLLRKPVTPYRLLAAVQQCLASGRSGVEPGRLRARRFGPHQGDTAADGTARSPRRRRTDFPNE